MTEEPITALFAYGPKGPQFTTKDLAFAINATGVPYPTAQARIKSYTKNKFVHARKTGSSTQPNKFEFSDMGAAVILSALQDAGIQDHHILTMASLTIYGWSGNATERDTKYIEPGSSHLLRHPIDRAVIGIGFQSEAWCFHVNIWRDTLTGDRTVSCDLYQIGDTFIGHAQPSETSFPQASVVVTLNSLLLPVARKLVSENWHGRAKG